MNKEIWKDIIGYEGLYQISNLGNVKSLKRNCYDINTKKIVCINKEINLKQNKDNKGYLTVKLQKNKTKKTVRIHRLVAEAFIPNLENKSQVNHKDGNKQNNCVDNLEWCDNDYNNEHAKINGLKKTRKIILINNITKEQIMFENLHKMFEYLQITPSGKYINYINKNKIFQKNYYIKDIGGI